jgi:hypothetical protein
MAEIQKTVDDVAHFTVLHTILRLLSKNILLK